MARKWGLTHAGKTFEITVFGAACAGLGAFRAGLGAVAPECCSPAPARRRAASGTPPRRADRHTRADPQKPDAGGRGGHGKQQRRLLLSGILFRTQCAHRRRGDLCGCCGICVTVEGERGARDRELKKETKGRGLSAGVRARACRHLWRAKETGGIDRAAHQEKRRAGAGGGLGEERGRVCFD